MVKKRKKKIGLREAKKILNQTYGKLEFNEERHEYKVANHKFETSATGFIKNFYTPFKKKFMAGMCAKKWNRENPGKWRNAKSFLDEWDAKNLEATTRGSRVHAYGETYPKMPEPQCIQEAGIKEWIDTLPKKYQVVFLELKMFNEKLGLVGTADVILRNKNTGKLIIADYKTNRAHILQNYNNNKLKAPFRDMLDTSYNHYKIQLSIYQLIIETTTPLEVEDRWVIWLQDGDYTTLPADKNPRKYKLDVDRATEEGEFYKRFSTPNLTSFIYNWILDKKVKKKDGKRNDN